MFGLGLQELLLFGVIAVLLFGKRLPEVAQSLGASYRDFRKGLSEIQSEMDFTSTVYNRTPPPPNPTTTQDYDEFDDYDEPTAPKLELPDVSKDDSANA